MGMENTYQKKADTVSFVDIPEIPQDRRAERAFLGSVLIQAEINYELMDILRPESFYFPNHKVIFEAMSALITRHEPIDMITLTSYLEDQKLLSHVGGKSAIADLVHEVPGAANIDSYARIIQKKSILRRLISAAADIGRLGYEQTNDTDEILDEAEKKIFSIANAAGTHKYKFLGDELKEAAERLVNLSKTGNELRGVPSGFKSLDNMLSGFQKSDLIILAARPSMGKTSLALDIARMAAVDHNIPVGIFSLEMSAQQLVDRMMSADSMVDAWKIRTGRVNMDDEFSKITNSLERLSKAPIYIDDQPGSTILKIRSTARRLKSEKNLQLIIIDYLQLIIPTVTRAQDSMVQQVTEISRSLKNLARELELPVIALSQLSRAVESRGGKPRLSDLRDSGCLAGDTLITDAQTGMRHSIKDLASKKEQLKVFALSDQFRIEKHQAIRFFSSGVKQLFLLKTRSGRSIRASANHPFRTLAGWKHLDQLSPDEHIAVPRAIEPIPGKDKLSENEVTFLAHLLGDGCILPKQPYHYTTASPMNQKTVTEVAYTLFQITARAVQQKNWMHIYFPSPYHLTHGKKHPITLWYEKLGIERVRSYEKRVPEAIFGCSKARIALFLQHLWSTDGNVSKKLLPGRKPSVSIYYASSSKTLAEQVAHLLLRLDVASTVRKAPSSHGYRMMYHVNVEESTNQIRFLQDIGIADERSLHVPHYIKTLQVIEPNTNVDAIPREAWRLVVTPAKEAQNMSWRDVARGLDIAYNGSALMQNGIGRERLATIGTLLASKMCAELATSDVLWDRIVSIEPDSVEEVYDATVPDIHNFVANDIIVHNSIEQDADVVMFIHREDKYTTDKTNIAEILIEKHRNGPIGKVDLYFDDKKTSFVSVDKSQYGEFHEDVANF